MSGGDGGSLGHVPENERWEFDEGVTAVFDDMLARSIPQYEVMRVAVHEMARSFRTRGSAIVDLGCSRGEQLARAFDEWGADNRYFGCEVSAPMLEAARARFAGHEPLVSIEDLDLRVRYPDCGVASVTTSVLTLQFIPINYRQKILATARDRTTSGGAFILVEKVLGAGAVLDDRMVAIYHAMKERAGYTREEIDRKRLALEGVLVPCTAAWNEGLLRGAGFREVDCFWRWMNFAAWVAVK